MVGSAFATMANLRALLRKVGESAMQLQKSNPCPAGYVCMSQMPNFGSLRLMIKSAHAKSRRTNSPTSLASEWLAPPC